MSKILPKSRKIDKNINSKSIKIYCKIGHLDKLFKWRQCLRVFTKPSCLFFYEMGLPRPLFYLFSSFQTQITIFTTNKCEKCPSSIQCQDLNSRPLEHDSPPITTRPGLPPALLFICRKRPFYQFSYSQCQNCFGFALLRLDKKLFLWEKVIFSYCVSVHSVQVFNIKMDCLKWKKWSTFYFS